MCIFVCTLALDLILLTDSAPELSAGDIQVHLQSRNSGSPVSMLASRRSKATLR